MKVPDLQRTTTDTIVSEGNSPLLRVGRDINKMLVQVKKPAIIQDIEDMIQINLMVNNSFSSNQKINNYEGVNRKVHEVPQAQYQQYSELKRFRLSFNNPENLSRNNTAGNPNSVGFMNRRNKSKLLNNQSSFQNNSTQLFPFSS